MDGMTNVQIYCKAKRVVESCLTETQLEVSKNYIDAATKFCDVTWCRDLYDLYYLKKREFSNDKNERRFDGQVYYRIDNT